ncbi:MAG TPA: dTDP-glucose 4,6-dehydratase [Candidatus Binataceae bacterium]|nr:dTDP-glucose 4,6-dehydratase [Candidatus Binataceae bacterium]
MSGKAVVLVTGGAGFIGANFVLDWLAQQRGTIVNLDKLTYAGNRDNLATLSGNPHHIFVEGDIGDTGLVAKLLTEHRPSAIVNFAAESHVDRSIHGPADFISTNIVGTCRLLESARAYFQTLSTSEQDAFRFIHISTDEVFGSLELDAPPFAETNQYLPNSPYSASKAASDHLVRAWHHTYRLPIIVTNCSNNYGPYQFPEKLIPLTIHHALTNKSLPLYGDGRQRRDWLYVTDHCAAIRAVLDRGRIGETYNIGGRTEKANVDVVNTLCEILDVERPRSDGRSYRQQIEFVGDRPGHDRRYAMNAGKIERELGWTPAETFESGLAKTARWYLDNAKWVERVVSGSYRDWMQKNYSNR